MYSVLGNASCDLHSKVKIKGQIMYFLVNASFDIATIKFAGA